jgi:hypothetical protein
VKDTIRAIPGFGLRNARREPTSFGTAVPYHGGLRASQKYLKLQRMRGCWILRIGWLRAWHAMGSPNPSVENKIS